MSDKKQYYVVYWTPVQVGSMIHTGSHPLLPTVYKQITKDIVRRINMQNLQAGVFLPDEACCITWVTEMPKEPIPSQVVALHPLSLVEAAAAN